jgi:putative phage-type endonuclease
MATAGEHAQPTTGVGVELLDYGTRERWLGARSMGVGASESAALFGVSPWETVLSLWAKKTNRIEPDEIAGEWLEWGNLLEEPIAKRYESRTGRKVWQGGPYCVAQHPTIECMRATPDRWVIEATDRTPDGLLQIKNTNAFKGHDWDDGPPNYIQIQVQHEMAVTGRSWASVAVLIGGAEFRFFDVERNPAFIEELETQVRWFWGFVERDERPPIDGSIRTLETLKKLHPKDSGEIVTLPDESLDWWLEMERIRSTKSQAEKDETAVKAKLFAAFGDATYGVLPDGRRLSLKTSNRAGYTCEATTFRSLRLEKGPKK